MVKQEWGVGIVDIDVSGAVPAFAAPKTTIAPLPPKKLEAITWTLGLASDRILRSAQLTNGPVFQVLELASAADVLAVDSGKFRYPEFLGVGSQLRGLGDCLHVTFLRLDPSACMNVQGIAACSHGAAGGNPATGFTLS